MLRKLTFAAILLLMATDVWFVWIDWLIWRSYRKSVIAEAESFLTEV